MRRLGLALLGFCLVFSLSSTIQATIALPWSAYLHQTPVVLQNTWNDGLVNQTVRYLHNAAPNSQTSIIVPDDGLRTSSEAEYWFYPTPVYVMLDFSVVRIHPTPSMAYIGPDSYFLTERSTLPTNWQYTTLFQQGNKVSILIKDPTL